ncbi:MAG: alpha/beta hydrolase [Gammaproteobacteria bacterium HGW-Gammaproteobacteria-3]|nr:MAG: alpha/beta hydrolase [Gammaproteobacteria bacterium HGW-Gammaproteobacteria-3]
MASKTIVLLRGLLRERRHWGDFLACLQQKLPESRLVTLDIPGNGALCHALSPSAISGITDTLRTRVETKPLTLVTLSMGGMIALDWMHRYPADINRAILINTSARPHAPFYWRLRWRNYAVLLSLLWQAPAAREKLILSLTSNRHQHDAKLLARWQNWQRQNPVTTQNALRQILAAATFKARQKPQAPLLLIASRHDRLVDYRCSRKLATAWDACYQEHSWGGHDLPLDDPNWLAETIASWLLQP